MTCVTRGAGGNFLGRDRSSYHSLAHQHCPTGSPTSVTPTTVFPMGSSQALYLAFKPRFASLRLTLPVKRYLAWQVDGCAPCSPYGAQRVQTRTIRGRTRSAIGSNSLAHGWAHAPATMGDTVKGISELANGRAMFVATPI